MSVDVTQALRDTENSLRDFIAFVLSKSGQNWISKCGVPSERIEKWKERKAVEEKRQEAGVVEERLIYYADFYDLPTILHKNWSGEFSTALGDWKTFKVYLDEIGKLRDADAHRRELLPHQKHLILGVSGEIRNRIVRYRSKMETSDDCFPRIESVRDSLGNIWVPDTNLGLKMVDTKATLRPGDALDFVITAVDPEDFPLEYSVYKSFLNITWQSNPNLQFQIAETHISRTFSLYLAIKSSRDYHASPLNDDVVQFIYSVIPNKGS
jgi:hypothetical protein